MIAHSLLAWVDQYNLSHTLTDETAAYYRRSIRTLENWTGCTLTAETLTDQTVNAALAKLIEAGRSPHYARSLKTGVLAVWRDMADAGMAPWPRRIRSIRSGPPAVRIWTPEQVGQILTSAAKLSGQFRTMPLDRATYFTTLIRVAWDTGMRRRDLHRLRHDQVGPDWVGSQHKTGKPIRARLRASTLEAIERWGRPPDCVLWPLWGSENVFQGTWKKIVAAAGLSHAPWKTIRKSAGTAAEDLAPGHGHELLGNSRRVFERHYLAQAVVAGPQPPELDCRV